MTNITEQPASALVPAAASELSPLVLMRELPAQALSFKLAWKLPEGHSPQPLPDYMVCVECPGF